MQVAPDKGTRPATRLSGNYSLGALAQMDRATRLWKWLLRWLLTTGRRFCSSLSVPVRVRRASPIMKCGKCNFVPGRPGVEHTQYSAYGYFNHCGKRWQPCHACSVFVSQDDLYYTQPGWYVCKSCNDTFVACEGPGCGGRIPTR